MIIISHNIHPLIPSVKNKFLKSKTWGLIVLFHANFIVNSYIHKTNLHKYHQWFQARQQFQYCPWL